MRFGIVLCAAAAVTLSACSKDKNADDKAAGAAPDTAVALTPATPRDSLHRPIGKIVRLNEDTDTVLVDGRRKGVIVTLVTSPENFPDRFSTYRTSDMQIATAKIGSSASMTFTPTLGARTNPDAFLQFQMDTVPLPAEDPAGATIASFNQGPKKATGIGPAPGYPWAQAAKSFSLTSNNQKIVGTVIVGKRGPRTYRILFQSPAADAQAMASNASLILKQWRWDDDYSYLIPSGRFVGDTTKKIPAGAIIPQPKRNPAKK